MRTLEEAIEYAEEVARANESLVSNYESDKIRAKIHRQLSAYLRELQERRKACDYWQEKAHSYEQTIFKLTDAISKQPEIIRCKGCKNYEWMSNRIPEEQTWHCHCWDADTGKDDFCSYAERRSE